MGSGQRVLIALVALAAALAGPACGQQCDRHCGLIRWPVKTLADPDAGRIDTAPQPTTVALLVALPYPRRHPGNARLAPVELTTWEVHAVLMGWQRSSDRDFHLVIANPEHHAQTMIVEVPSPTCPEICRTGHAATFAALRQLITDRLGAPPAWLHRFRDPIPVRVVGVGFFDLIHGEVGAAPNGIELHPVMALEFTTRP